MATTTAIWTIAGLATAGVIARPMRWPEWIWAVGGAFLLLALGLVDLPTALGAVGKASDVYLFLIGMMLLSEAARAEGLFDWVAAVAVDRARQSPVRLYALIYAAGVVVTTFLSNDATAVVMTPAVFAAARKAKVDPLPLLLSCALVANAASFVLPISNPANLVLYGGHMPSLGQWLRSFAWPSVAAIVVTFAMLWLVERKRLQGVCASDIARPQLTRGGGVAIAAIALTAGLLIVTSALDKPLGLPTAIAGVMTTLMLAIVSRRSPLKMAGDVSWGVLLLVAGLFVLVEAVDHTGVIARIADALKDTTGSPVTTAAVSGTVLAFVSNLMNNLPAGLIAATAVAQAQPPRIVVDALLIGVDLGPNLSVTGSLATILWLQAIRREGEDVTFWRFLRVGIVVMPTALAAAIGVRILIG